MENEDFDLYGDLDEALIEPLQEEVQKKQAEELEKQKKDENFREETEKIINELKTSNFQLKKNMSLLLATAKSEIDRKDQQIKDLRREMDEIIFRKNKGSKKTCEKWSQTELNENNRSNSSRPNESNKLHDRHKPKEPADSNDRHKRKLSPERRYSDDYRKTSHRDENGSRSKNYNGMSRKLSLENFRSRSPEKHEKKSTKQELREDDLRKTLLKNKNDDKSSSSNKESTKKTDSSSGRDKYKEKYRIKEKNGSKSEKHHDEKRDKKKSDQKDSKKDKVVKEKLLSQKIVKEEVKDPKPNEIDVLQPEKSSSSKKNETIVEKTAQEILKLEKVDVMPSNLNLSAESDTNEVTTEKVAIKNVMEVKVEENEKMPDESKETVRKTKEEAPVKIEESAPKKRKYVPIFEAKIFPGSIEIKSDEIKSENIPTAKKEDEQSKSAQKFITTDKPTSIELLPITVKIDKSSEVIQKKEETVIITEEITAPITEVMQEIKKEDIPEVKIEINSATESLNGSFESTKENSSEKKKHKKRKIITTELESDGTIVWTLTRKKRKTKEHS